MLARAARADNSSAAKSNQNDTSLNPDYHVDLGALVDAPGERVTPGAVGLSRCAAGQFCYVWAEDQATGAVLPAARSYDAQPWEAVYPLLLRVECADATECVLVVPESSTREFFVSAKRAPAVSHEQQAARYLTKGSFGPSQADIDAFPNAGGSFTDSARQWVSQQMGMPASLHRAEYRRDWNIRNLRPVPTGGVYEPCEVGARYVEFVFLDSDVGNLLSTSTSGGVTRLLVNGQLRGEAPSDMALPSEAGPWPICAVSERIGGSVSLGSDCSTMSTNPAVSFSSAPSGQVAMTNAQTQPVHAPAVQAHLLATAGASCTRTGASPTFIRSATLQNKWLMFDPRLKLQENSLEAPAVDATPGQPGCPVVAKTFLNAHTCVAAAEACFPMTYTASNGNPLRLTLTDATIRAFYTKGGVYAYYVTNLDVGYSAVPKPCDAQGTVSRWMRTSDCTGAVSAGSGANQATIDHLSTLITAADDGAHVIDIQSWDGKTRCTTGSKGMKLDISGECWQHVHPHEYNVYNFDFWVQGHFGNGQARANKRPNPIAKTADIAGSPNVVYPHRTIMSRWHDRVSYHTLIGRYKQRIDFSDLPASLQGEGIVQHFGAVPAGRKDSDFEACGSPGEVANTPVRGAVFPGHLTQPYDFSSQRLDQYTSGSNHKRTKAAVWANVVHSAPDQLRQRVAWALSQILVITDDSIGTQMAEAYGLYYDIMVRHAFGKYRDILKEVAFSPMMATMLTYLNSRSLGRNLASGLEQYPDENFAREVMQLFSVGLWELHQNGTLKLDARGQPISTYTNEDIADFSRIWTGFRLRSPRENVEKYMSPGFRNIIDPLVIERTHHDEFSKLGMHNQYIGDTYPPCWSLPAKHYLRVGAHFSYLGHDPSPRMHDGSAESAFFSSGVIPRMVLPAGSALAAQLCVADGAGKPCKPQSEVTLGANLECTGKECDVNTVRVVQVERGAGLKPVYFEYIRPPCVEYAFPEQGHAIASSWKGNSICVDERLEVGYGACCEPNGKRAETTCEDVQYRSERISRPAAVARCAAKGKELCYFQYITRNTDTTGEQQCWSYDNMYWGEPCSSRVQIHADERVGVVNQFADFFDNRPNYPQSQVQLHNPFTMRVVWGPQGAPSVTSDGSSPDPSVCDVVTNDKGAKSLLCNITVSSHAVFTAAPAGPAELIARLRVGHPSIESFDAGTYAECTSSACSGLNSQGVKVYNLAASANAFDVRTVFQFTHKGRLLRLANVAMKVQVGSLAEFINPPMFMSHIEATGRDVHHEIDAALDHYVEHSNNPPFLATALIKRLVTSNPSPRYVGVVAQAYIDGVYAGIGSGAYGDLGAATAAVMLDPEATSPELAMDSSYGKLREPVVKLLHALRALDYEPSRGQVLDLTGLESRLAMNPFMSPTVFNFFQDDYTPPGPLADAGLTGPEAQIMSTPTLISWMNGILSLAEFGMTDCYYGFGIRNAPSGCWRTETKRDPASLTWSGHLAWQPAGGVDAASSAAIDQLDLALTGGRLRPESRAVILEQVQAQDELGGSPAALSTLFSLMLNSIEFSVTGAYHFSTGEAAVPEPMPTPPEITDYKAIVYVYLNGGLDSFNLLMPHSGCQSNGAGTPLDQQYAAIRGDVGMAKSEMLAIDASGQPCSKFGVHEDMPFLQQLYNDGDASFVANIGPLVEPVTKQEFFKRSKEMPPSLYAHNSQRKCTQSVIAQDPSAKGVLGRLRDALAAQGLPSAAYSASGNSLAVEGSPNGASAADIVHYRDGATPFDPDNVAPHIHVGLSRLHANTSGSMVGETWTRLAQAALFRAGNLSNSMSAGSLATGFADSSRLGSQLVQVARIMAAKNQIGSHRDVFYVELGGFDTHSAVKDTLHDKFTEINAALEGFVAELKGQGIWDNTLIMTASEFARTLVSNGEGTDHAWGGNMFMAGGGLNGGQIHGHYPGDLTVDGPDRIDRGRVVPTTAWEGLWKSITLWFSLEDATVNSVLPNLPNFPDSYILSNVFA